MYMINFHYIQNANKVVAKVWGYRKIWLQSNQIFEMGTFSLPPLEYETRAFFIDLDLDIQKEVGFPFIRLCVYVCVFVCRQIE